MNAHIDAVKIADTPSGPVPAVVLAVEGETDVVPIFIGFEEATAITQGLDAADFGRPLTHDLLLDTIEELGGRVERVVIDALVGEGEEGGTYTADLYLDTPRSATTIDARPSDSLALAVRTNADIEMADTVFEQGRRDPDAFENLQDIREAMGPGGPTGGPMGQGQGPGPGQ